MDLITKREEVVKAAAPWELSVSITQTQAHLCMFPGLGSFPQKAHKSNQTWLRSRQTSAHCWTCRKHESGGSSRHCGHGFGPRGRFFVHPDACRLTQADWDHYMSNTSEAQKVDTPQALLAPPGPPLTKVRLTDLRRALLRQRNFKAHPQDTLPPEILKILAWFYPDFLKIMDRTTLAAIRKTRAAPTLWSLSLIWPVPKHNGKQGLQEKRPVNGVHCFSHAFMRLSYKRPDPSPYVFGGVAGRRSEEALGAALNIQARCLRAGKSYLFKLRDVRGAFTNVTHESVRQHLEATQRVPEAAIHHNQHINTELRTPGGGDWRITKGTRQGDFGCDIFLGVYDIPLKKYVRQNPTLGERRSRNLAV